jgi:ribosomal silencing factor RsfS
VNVGAVDITGDIVVHIMQPAVSREYYKLEEFLAARQG